MRSEPLDALRGVAISMVVAKHYFGFSLGVLGVDLFFVLSGFLIGGILLDSRDQRSYFAPFYGRRAFRILPLYWLLLVIAPPTHWGFYLFFAQQIPWLQFGYTQTEPAFVAWSLAVEEQFYLLLPALIFWLPRRWLVRVLWCGVLMAPIWRWLFHAYLPEHSFQFLLPGRLDDLFGGVLIACFMRGYCRSRALWGGLAYTPVLCDLAYAQFVQAMPPLSVIAAVWWFVTWTAASAARLPAMLWPLVWVGRRCYALYLFHLVVGNVAWEYSPAYAPFIALPIACIVAEISWRLIESPLIEYAKMAFPRGTTGRATLCHAERLTVSPSRLSDSPALR